MFNKATKYKASRLFAFLLLSAFPLIGGNVLAMDRPQEEEQKYIPTSLSVPQSAIIEQWNSGVEPKKIAVSGIYYKLKGHIRGGVGKDFLDPQRPNQCVTFNLTIGEYTKRREYEYKIWTPYYAMDNNCDVRLRLIPMEPQR
jgi:hypothetical protein